MDRDKVISTLEEIKKQTAGIGLGSAVIAHEFIDKIIAMLKEQDAKPVIVTTNAYGTRFYHCPRCNRDLYAYPRQLYCSNCGQAVKWE